MECPRTFGEGKEEPQGESQSYYGSDTGTTDSNGYLFLSVSSLPGDLVLMHVYRLSVQYATISFQNNSTSTATTLYPEFHIGVDSDVNGVVDVWELPLAEKFVPSFRLHSTTDWIAPEPVEYINADLTSGLWFSVINVTGQKVGDYRVTDEALFNPPVSNWHPWINNPNSAWETLTFDPFDYQGQPPGAGYNDYHLRFHFGFNGNPDPNTWSPAYQNERNNNAFDHTVYAHFFKYGSEYVIQYWILYPYNDGYNNHEGDWEHINVHLDSQNPSEANIVEIDFYFHEKVRTVTAGNFETDGGSTHPIIYVGGECIGINSPLSCSPGETTGGSYPAPGIWFDVGELGYDEYVSGNGPYIPYSEFIDGNSSNRRQVSLMQPIWGGLFGATVGFFGGGLLGAALGDGSGYDGVGTAIVGAGIGEALVMPLGVHYGNKRQGKLSLDLLTSVAIAGTGLLIMDASNTKDSFLVLVPILQIGATVAVERATVHSRNK